MKMDGGIPEGDMEKVEAFAALTKLEPLYMDGSLEMYRKLLMLEDCDDVAVLRPGERVTDSMFWNR
jgi:hypothetical protein